MHGSQFFFLDGFFFLSSLRMLAVTEGTYIYPGVLSWGKQRVDFCQRTSHTSGTTLLHSTADDQSSGVTQHGLVPVRGRWQILQISYGIPLGTHGEKFGIFGTVRILRDLDFHHSLPQRATQMSNDFHGHTLSALRVDEFCFQHTA